mgnify:CR=1 FL=1
MYGFFLFYVTYDDVLYNRAVIDNSEYSFPRSIPIAAKWISRCVRIKTMSRRWWYYPTKNLILILKWKSILTTPRLIKRQLRSERKKRKPQEKTIYKKIQNQIEENTASKFIRHIWRKESVKSACRCTMHQTLWTNWSVRVNFQRAKWIQP